jgi:hypothetical protein
MDYFFTKIFISSLRNNFPNKKIRVDKRIIDKLESALQDFIYNVMGFRFGNNYDLGEVRAYFDNICRHISFNDNESLIDAVKKYQEEYVTLIDNHPYTRLFINVLKRIYSKEYNGKLSASSFEYNITNAGRVLHFDDYIIVCRQSRYGEVTLPNIKISSYDRFEEILREYIDSIKESNTFYNTFNNPAFDVYSEDEKIMMIFEGTIYNASSYEFTNMAGFFTKYAEFISDDSFKDMNHVEKIGEAIDDEVYTMVKKSSVEYETPYYFSFILKNHHLELPNTRIGIRYDGDKKVACIMATQSSQITPQNREVSEYIKDNIPRTSKYRQYNPDHLVSLILTFGVLNGMGIKDIEVVDYMPLRCYKTVKDRHMNEDEASYYMMRIVNKNIFTYYKLITICNGIDVREIPDGLRQLSIHLDDTITCESEFITSLYNMAYEYGLKHREEEPTLN